MKRPRPPELDFGDRPGGKRPGYQPTPPPPSAFPKSRHRRPARPGALAKAQALARKDPDGS